MLFSEKYPEAIPNQEFENGNYFYAEKADNCYMCGKLTHFVEMNAETYICSEECDGDFYFQIFSHAINQNNNNNIIDF